MLIIKNRLEIERQTIADLLKFPEIFPDIDGIVKENFFSTKLNQIIFGIIRNCLLQKEPVDKTVISNKIANLNLHFEIEPFDYLAALESIQLNKNAALGRFKELAKINAKEILYKAAEEQQKYLNNSQNDSFQEIIATLDSIHGKTINNFSLEGEPVDVFAGAEEYIEELGNLDGTEEIPFPFPRFQSFYGGLEAGTLSLFIAGYKVGKSWFLLNLLKRIVTENENIEGLYIDTEMSTEEVKRRLVAEIAGINEYYLRHGWRKNKELCEKVRNVWPVISKWFGKIQHIYVGNITQEETESIIRRWVWKKRAEKPNVKPIVFYDYFKLHGGDSIKDAFASSMVLGYKVDGIKKISQELKIPIVAAAQTNASGEVGLSKEMPKFVDSAYKLRLRSTEEIEEEGGFATHKIESICNRSLGPQLKQFNDKVKMGKDKDGRTIWKDNAILYKFKDFRVEELNTLSEQMNLQIMPKKPVKKEGGGDLF